jgi:aspartate kinase
MALLSMCLTDMGVDAISFTGSQVGIITDTAHTDARIVDVRGQRLLEEIDRGRVVIVAGFQGVSLTKEVTTLGRGGSDTTAVALAAAFHARDCEILTDVDGVMTAHPHVVPCARLRRALSYAEMIEMASLGAQVLHPRAAEMALRYGVRLHVRSSFHEGQGTMVVDEATRTALEGDEIAGITHDRDVALVRVDGAAGIATRAIAVLAATGITPLVLAHAPGAGDGEALGVGVPGAAGQRVADHIAASIEARVAVQTDLALVSIVGKSVLGHGPLLSAAFAALAAAGIPVVLTSTSAITASAVVPAPRVEDAVRALHTALVETHGS